MKTSEKCVTLALLAVFLVLGVWVLSRDLYRKETSPSHKTNEVVGQTWGWAKLTTKPARIEISLPSCSGVELLQAEFQMPGAPGPLSVFVDTRAVFPAGGYKVGDEVLIAVVQSKVGDGSGNTYSMGTYFVVDYRKAGTTNSLR